MPSDRRWYREPETFIAVAALVVSVTAVAVGAYEAWLQRTHDRAEAWPRVEIGTWVTDSLVTVRLDNTGIGPAIIHYVDVRVDGRAQVTWDSALTTLYGHTPPPHSTESVVEHALRAGDRTPLIAVPTSSVARPFYPWIGRVLVSVCYSSVFAESWLVVDTLGKSGRWTPVSACPKQGANTDL